MANVLLQTAWLIPCYPLIGTILAVPWSPAVIRLTGPRPAGYVNIVMTLFAFVHGLLALPATWNQPTQYVDFEWLQAAGLNLTLPLEYSSITIGITILVTGINLLAQIYAVGYMEMDWGWARFFSLLAFFEAGMCGLALCNSLFFSYMILEILTLGTYLLVGLWFSQPLVVTGARDAFLTKRVGDLILLMGVVALLPIAGTWNFSELAIWAKTANIDPKVATLLGLALIAGPMGKCAQFPLHLWLDEAMEGPLPSTIVRNSVVVSIAIWILVKLEPVIALSPFTLSALVFIGSVTAVGATLIAIAQIDIKRTLSYLASAYMGLAFIAVGVEQTQTALFLVFTYAVAMALLVMSVGGVIWNSISQDVTQYGGLWSKRPASGLSFLVGAAGLMALPPFGSFWAVGQLANQVAETTWLFGLLLVVNGLTAFGLTRVFSLIFGNKPQPMTERSPEIAWPMALPMMILTGVVLHVPLLLLQWQILPLTILTTTATGLLLVSTVAGVGLAGLIYLNPGWKKPVKLPWQPLQDLLAYDFYTAEIYRFTVVLVVGAVSQIMYWFDRYIVDGFVNLVGMVTVFSGQSLKYNTSGQTQFYALTILLGIGLLGILVSWPILSRLSLIVG